MDEIRNILVESPTEGSYTIDAVYFFQQICDMDPEPLVAITNGRLFEKDGIKYCIDVNAFELDPVADAWFYR